MSSAVVAIPIYKAEPNSNEVISLTQCVRVLKDHPIVFFAPHTLDTRAYEAICRGHADFRAERFDDYYFKGIQGYNWLLLSKEFYNRFKQYEYMLIHQPDVFVFEDQLRYWCDKGFDYIGSPWFEGYHDADERAKFTGIGNGGFSLRNIPHHLKVLNDYFYRSYRYNMGKKERLKAWLEYPVLKVQGLIGENESIRKYYPENEDWFWSKLSTVQCPWFKIPSFDEALGFGFEVNAPWLMKQNGGKLPFGCHAWERYQPEFWKPFIESFGFKITT